MVRTAIFNLRRTCTVPMPTAASTATCRAATVTPPGSRSSPRWTSAPGSRTNSPGARASFDADVAAVGGRVLDRDHRVCAVRQRCPGHDLDRVSLRQGRGCVAGGGDGRDRQCCGHGREVGGAQGVAVHLGVAEHRQVQRRGDVGGEHPPERRGHLDRLGGEVVGEQGGYGAGVIGDGARHICRLAPCRGGCAKVAREGAPDAGILGS